MAEAETEYTSEQSSLIERLINSRNRDLGFFLPFIFGLSNTPNTPNPDQDSPTPDQETPQNPPNLRQSTDRIILINPFTQGMVLIEAVAAVAADGNWGSGDSSSSSYPSLEDWLREMLSKEGQPPASKESMEAMPDVEIGEVGEECVICLEELPVGGMAKEMPCNHRFHGECIQKWLKIHGSCPLCRYKMPVEENDDKSLKSGENSGRRREIWFSLGLSNSNSSSSSDRRSEESNESGSNDSVDSSQTD